MLEMKDWILEALGSRQMWFLEKVIFVGHLLLRWNIHQSFSPMCIIWRKYRHGRSSHSLLHIWMRGGLSQQHHGEEEVGSNAAWVIEFDDGEEADIWISWKLFHKEYQLPCRLFLCLVKNHGIFYITNKGARSTVFLKEAYDGFNLIEKCPLLRFQDRFMSVTRWENMLWFA